MKNPAAFRGVFSCYLSRDEIRPRCGQLHEAYTCFFSSTFSSSPFKADLKLRMPSPRPFATSGIFLPPNSSTAIPRMTRSSMGPIDLIRTPYNIIVGAVEDARQARRVPKRFRDGVRLLHPRFATGHLAPKQLC